MRVIDLIGVVEDGSPLAVRSPLAPINPRITIGYRQGETLLIRYKVLTAGGQAVDLAKDSATLTLTIRKAPAPAGAVTKAYASTIPAGPVELGRADFTILATDLPASRVPWGRYTYDVTLRRAVAGVDRTTPLSPFVIEPGDG